jgi:hypothetical protein
MYSRALAASATGLILSLAYFDAAWADRRQRPETPAGAYGGSCD